MLRHEDLYHVGIVVREIAAAKEEYEHSLGLTWGIEAEMEAEFELEDGRRSAMFCFAYSNEGPVRIELLRAIDGTFIEPTADGELHHLGYWSDDVTRDASELAAAGMTRLGALYTIGENGPPAAVYLRPRHGGIVELVASEMKAMLFPSG